MKPIRSLRILLIFISLCSCCCINFDCLAWQDTTPVFKKKYSKRAIESDINYLTQTVARVHPNMYHNISPQHYRLLVDSVKKQLHEGMTEREIWPLLGRLIGALGEGHSVMDFPFWVYDTLKSGQPLLLPFLVNQFTENALVVKTDLSDEKKMVSGDKIIAVNGIVASALIDKLSSYCGGMLSYRAMDVCNNLSTCFYLYAMPAPYRIQFLHEQKLDSVLVNPITYSSFVARRAERIQYLQMANKQFPYVFDHSDTSCAYIAINTLAEKPDRFRRFLDSCFGILKAKPSRNLIIDLRNNGGGNSALGEMLLGYITDKAFRMTGGEKWKVSKDYKAQLLQNNSVISSHDTRLYLKSSNGQILDIAPERVKKPAKNSLLYNGKVWILIGPQTFSSANMLANVIKDFHLATIVGTATGEPANDYGELIYLQLPNTKFSFTTSTKQFIRANGDAGNDLPVIPDYPMKDSLLAKKGALIKFINAH